MTQQFVAKAGDAHGNEITDAAFVWAAVAGGAIDETGLFTAGADVGTFEGAVTLKAAHDGAEIMGSSDVEVTTQFISYFSRASNFSDFTQRIMMTPYPNGDPQLILTRTSGNSRLSWYPDGLRFVVEDSQVDGGIKVIGIEGSDQATGFGSISPEMGDSPRVSPDGKKLAFNLFRRNFVTQYSSEHDIFVMDIDGGNLVQVTDTPLTSERVQGGLPTVSGSRLPNRDHHQQMMTSGRSGLMAGNGHN